MTNYIQNMFIQVAALRCTILLNISPNLPLSADPVKAIRTRAY